jgi:pyridoxamine 5'-phosphate oxidase
MDQTEPLELISRWVQEARSAGLVEHDAVGLTTVSEDGRPSARTVSLRSADREGLIVTTALWTRKARELRANPWVAMLFHWPTLRRQIAVSGRAELAERALAEEIFARRDRPHQLQSLVSRQGEPIDDLAPLRRRLAEVREELGDRPAPVPDDWAAVRIHPAVIEFWEGADDALHDRRVAERDGPGWRWTRLAP